MVLWKDWARELLSESNSGNKSNTGVIKHKESIDKSLQVLEKRSNTQTGKVWYRWTSNTGEQTGTDGRVDETEKDDRPYDDPNGFGRALLEPLGYHLVQAVAHASQFRGEPANCAIGRDRTID